MCKTGNEEIPKCVDGSDAICTKNYKWTFEEIFINQCVTKCGVATDYAHMVNMKYVNV